jgi:hypothetical protein
MQSKTFILLLIYLYNLYLTALSVNDTIYRRMVGKLMDDELESVWKETVMT